MTNTNTYAVTEKKQFDFTLSENPLGCSLKVKEALSQMSFDPNQYPKPFAVELCQALANRFNLSFSNFFISNGSESIINLIPRVFANEADEAIVPALTFPMFAASATAAGLKVVKVPMTKRLDINLIGIQNAISKKTAIVFLCNPNNPTGSVIEVEKLRRLILNIPTSVLIVLDEASIEFGGESCIDLINKIPNLIILRTFSKAFGLANFRVGFAATTTDRVNSLKAVTGPFPIPSICTEAAISALSDQRFINKTKRFIASERDRISKMLIDLGFIVFPSQTNNLFVQIPEAISKEQFLTTLTQANISVVLGAKFEDFDNRFFRLSIRSKAMNNRFLLVMKDLIEKGECDE